MGGLENVVYEVDAVLRMSGDCVSLVNCRDSQTCPPAQATIGRPFRLTTRGLDLTALHSTRRCSRPAEERVGLRVPVLSS